MIKINGKLYDVLRHLVNTYSITNILFENATKKSHVQFPPKMKPTPTHEILYVTLSRRYSRPLRSTTPTQHVRPKRKTKPCDRVSTTRAMSRRSYVERKYTICSSKQIFEMYKGAFVCHAENLEHEGMQNTVTWQKGSCFESPNYSAEHFRAEFALLLSVDLRIKHLPFFALAALSTLRLV